MKIPISRIFQTVLRIALGGLFLWAAIAKMTDLPTFIAEAGRYRILPYAIVPIMAKALVGIELAASLMLLLGIRVRLAAAALALLLTLFILALSQALLRHLDLTCGCFGGKEPASWLTVGRDLIMLLACLALARIKPLQTARSSAFSKHWVAAVRPRIGS